MGTGLSPRQMHRLDLACAPLREVFVEGKGPFTDLYLVGSAVKGDNSAGRRDVDVRLMLDAPEYAALVNTIGIEAVRFLGIAIGDHLAAMSGLPVDFQIQQTQEANEKHGGGYRNPLGCRSMGNFIGDGEPELRSGTAGYQPYGDEPSGPGTG